ncbi:hypothetical protein N656DRAFT_439806 [Canariomyces notabilis]|uniref:Uncharacterized protein n=1 Tax=Canariomyces notabilis TaxID=2074819 RepID=A0AAN6QEX6_9PEZI|nr:hypothetical protein N656DRAFT_439806 [Canariomyces arenarius]
MSILIRLFCMYPKSLHANPSAVAIYQKDFIENQENHCQPCHDRIQPRGSIQRSKQPDRAGSPDKRIEQRPTAVIPHCPLLLPRPFCAELGRPCCIRTMFGRPREFLTSFTSV